MNGTAAVDPPSYVQPWAAAGFEKELVPVCGPRHVCQSPGKRPHCSGWETGTFAPADFKPGGNLGLRTRYFPALDIDVENRAIVEVVEDVAHEILGSTARRHRSNSTRCAYLFRLGGEPFEKAAVSFSCPDGTRAKIEILGAGQQLVVDGVHHSGARLEWSTAPSTGGLAILTAGLRDEFLSAVRGALVAAGCHLEAEKESRNNGARTGGQSAHPTRAAAREAFNLDYARDWGKPGECSCPMCGHNGCFGRLPKIPAKWWCWSPDHPSTAGQRHGDKGYFGDALDVEAFLAGRNTTEHLRAEGYLDEEEQRQDAATEPWPTPEPFDRIAVPEFPTALLPDWQRRFVEAVALETETKPDLAAMCVLTATAAACARRFTIEQRPGFHVPANIWTLTMLSSGNRKSAVFDRTVTPLREYEAEQSLALAPRIAVERSQHRRLERLLANAEKAAVNAKEDLARRAAQAEADQLAEQFEKHKVTHEPCLFLAEATPERLEEVLMEQGGRAAVLASEPALLRALAGLGNGSRNGADPNLSSILDAHDGGDVRVGRMRRDNGGGGDRIVRGAVVTIGLAPQPERVFSALRAGPAFLESGFAWRFLFSLPGTLLGHRTHATPSTPESVLVEYAARMRELLALPEKDVIPVLRLTPEAHEALLAFERQIEPAMRPEGELAAAVPWASKLTSRLARIAGLLHAAENRREPWLSPVELRVMERAIALADYFIPHARAVLLELGSDPIVKRARRALEWIRRERIATFTKHDLHRAIAKNEAAGAAEAVIDPVLRFLEGRDYVRAGAAAEKRTGRPPSPSYNVNPKAIEVKDGH